MTSWRSRDGHWQVHPISLNGQPMLRVETDYPVMPLTRAGLRTGPSQLRPGWFLAGDVTHVSQIEQWVPLAELEEA